MAGQVTLVGYNRYYNSNKIFCEYFEYYYTGKSSVLIGAFIVYIQCFFIFQYQVYNQEQGTSQDNKWENDTLFPDLF